MAWSAKTIRAWKGSIKKWEQIVAGTGGDNGSENCPLCDLFIHNDCQGCPVAQEAGDYGCRNTPYDAWEEALDDELCRGLRDPFFNFNQCFTAEYGNKALDDLSVMCAVLELEFLKSLRPGRKNDGHKDLEGPERVDPKVATHRKRHGR